MADTAVVKIFNEENKQVRMLKVRADSGFNRFYWGMEGKGIRQAGSRGGGRRSGGNTTEPGGLPVDPGTYKVVISLSKENTDSLMVVVNDNPLAPVNKEIRDGKRKFAERLDKTILKLTDLTDRLNELDEIIKKIESSYNYMEKKDADTLSKISKAMTDSIKVIREIVPIYPSLKDLMIRTSGRDKYETGNHELTLDHQNTEYCRNFIFNDKRGVFYSFPMEECVPIALSRSVDWFTVKIENCWTGARGVWDGFEMNNIKPTDTYKLTISGTYDVPGTFCVFLLKASNKVPISFKCDAVHAAMDVLIKKAILLNKYKLSFLTFNANPHLPNHDLDL